MAIIINSYIYPMALENQQFRDKQAQRNVTDQLTFKDKLSSLSNLPRFFRLVWQTSKGLTIANSALRIARSATPVAILYVGKLIIDEVIRISQVQGATAHTYLWTLIAVEFALAILSDALTRAITLLDSLLGDLFSNYTSVKIMEHAATLDLDQFENSHFYDKLERARQQTTGRTILLSQVLTQVQDLITMCFLAAGLLAFNPWLILLLLVAIIPAFIGESYFNDRSYALSRRQTPQRRELDYMRFIGASDETAKEVKLFNLSDFLVQRFKALANRFYTDNKQLAIKRSAWGAFFAMLGSVGYYGAYLFIILRSHSAVASALAILLFWRVLSASYAACLKAFSFALPPYRKAPCTLATSLIFSTFNRILHNRQSHAFSPTRCGKVSYFRM